VRGRTLGQASSTLVQNIRQGNGFFFKDAAEKGFLREHWQCSKEIKMMPYVIRDLDLEPIMVKIMDEEEGLGWSLDLTKRVAEEYKKYLLLCLMYPNEALIPSSHVDDFWHFHILDTLKYQEDCKMIFGYFLHHFPYFGMRGKQDEDNLKKAWENSCTIYVENFGPMDSEIWQSSKRCPNCGRRCKDATNYFMDERPRLSTAFA